METVDNRSFKEKAKDLFGRIKVKATDTYNGAKRTIEEHPGETFTILVISIPGILKVVNSLIRSGQADKERRFDECDYYDPRTGEHWYTRKPLTANQKLNLEQRYKAGESKGEILKSMRML